MLIDTAVDKPKIPENSARNDGSECPNSEHNLDARSASEKYGEARDKSSQVSESSLESKIRKYSDKDVENELKKIWEKQKFWGLPASVAQAEKICKALILVEKNSPSSKNNNSSMAEARKSVNELLNLIERRKVATNPIQTDLAAAVSSPNIGLRQFINLLSQNLGRVERHVDAVNYLAFNEQFIDNENKTIRSPYSRVIDLVMVNEISRDRKKQILVLSYFIDRKIEEFNDLDLRYIKGLLCDIERDIDGFWFRSKNHDWKSDLETHSEPNHPE